MDIRFPPIEVLYREAALDSLCRWRNGTCNDAAKSRDKVANESWPIEWWMDNMIEAAKLQPATRNGNWTDQTRKRTVYKVPGLPHSPSKVDQGWLLVVLLLLTPAIAIRYACCKRTGMREQVLYLDVSALPPWIGSRYAAISVQSS